MQQRLRNWLCLVQNTLCAFHCTPWATAHFRNCCPKQLPTDATWQHPAQLYLSALALCPGAFLTLKCGTHSFAIWKWRELVFIRTKLDQLRWWYELPSSIPCTLLLRCFVHSSSGHRGWIDFQLSEAVINLQHIFVLAFPSSLFPFPQPCSLGLLLKIHWLNAGPCCRTYFLGETWGPHL